MNRFDTENSTFNCITMERNYWYKIISSFNQKHLSIILFVLPIISLAQKNVTHQTLFWYGYYLKAKLSDRVHWNGEIQERHFVDKFAQHQLVIRNNLKYNFNNKIAATVGLVGFLQSPNNPYSESDLVVPELRTDIGIEAKQKFEYFNLTHRFKTEARFFHHVNSADDKLGKGFYFGNFRFRYQFGIDVPLVKFKNNNQSQLVVRLRDEVMFNVGPAINKNTFDQNRIYGALYYKINSKLGAEVGYLNWYQKRSTGNDYYVRDIIRLSFYHTLN